MTTPIVDRLIRRMFGEPLVRNDLRGELVEEIIAMALEQEWECCGSDWFAWDLVHRTNGLRIQVKQSAARQTWHREGSPPTRPSFDLRERTGRYGPHGWIEDPGRNADIFIFGWHNRTDDGADHREPDQWQFYVIAERDLPDQKSISLPVLMRIVESVAYCDLPQRVNAVAAMISTDPS